jgi:multiple sugar transport system ATP-binding protein
MVFQNYALYPHMTVFENMAFGLRLRRFKRKEIRERIDAAAEILGIKELLTRRPKELSGGQKQRVAVGRAIVRDPRVFLFDEPLSNLDAKLRVQMRAELSRLHNRLHATMVYVTHDQTEAMTMGDRIVVLKDGEIQQTAGPLQLYNSPDNIFVAGFIGSPAMNFLKGTIDGNRRKRFVSESLDVFLGDKEMEVLRPYAGKDVVWGIRPEHLVPGKGKQRDGFAAKISVVEPMGNEIFLHLDMQGTALIARVDSRPGFKVGDDLALMVCIDKSHFFDPTTGKRIA